MKKNSKATILSVIIFTIAIVLSWGGLLYATNDPNHFRIIGVIASFVGYGLFFWGVIRYENDCKN